MEIHNYPGFQALFYPLVNMIVLTFRAVYYKRYHIISFYGNFFGIIKSNLFWYKVHFRRLKFEWPSSDLTILKYSRSVWLREFDGG